MDVFNFDKSTNKAAPYARPVVLEIWYPRTFATGQSELKIIAPICMSHQRNPPTAHGRSSKASLLVGSSVTAQIIGKAFSGDGLSD